MSHKISLTRARAKAHPELLVVPKAHRPFWLPGPTPSLATSGNLFLPALGPLHILFSLLEYHSASTPCLSGQLIHCSCTHSTKILRACPVGQALAGFQHSRLSTYRRTSQNHQPGDQAAQGSKSLFSWGLYSLGGGRHLVPMNKSTVSDGIFRDRAWAYLPWSSGKAILDRVVKGTSRQTAWAHRERTGWYMLSGRKL